MVRFIRLFMRATGPCRFECQQRQSALKVLKTRVPELELTYGSSKYLQPTPSSVHLPPSDWTGLATTLRTRLQVEGNFQYYPKLLRLCSVIPKMGGIRGD